MDQRQYVRVPVHLPVQFFTDSGKIGGEGELQDWSPAGCRVRSSVPVPLNAELELVISSRGDTHPFIIDGALVRWSVNQEFGVAFTRVRAEAQRRVAQLYRKLAPPSSSAMTAA